ISRHPQLGSREQLFCSAPALAPAPSCLPPTSSLDAIVPALNRRWQDSVAPRQTHVAQDGFGSRRDQNARSIKGVRQVSCYPGSCRLPDTSAKATQSSQARPLLMQEKSSPRSSLFGRHSESRRFHCKALPDQIDVSAQVIELVRVVGRQADGLHVRIY